MNRGKAAPDVAVRPSDAGAVFGHRENVPRTEDMRKLTDGAAGTSSAKRLS